MKRRLGFVVESGTDVRLVEGMAERFELTVLARKILGGVEISREPSQSFNRIVGPASRIRFALTVARYVRRHRSDIDCWVVQGYALAALAANFACRVSGLPVRMLVCSPVEAYYRCRLNQPHLGLKYRASELLILRSLAKLNARMGAGYVVLSEHLGEVVKSHGTRRPIHKVPLYGVDTENFRPPEAPREEVKARLNLPTSGNVIFFSSRVAPEKDSETLLRAVRTLNDEGRKIWLLHRSGGYEEFLAAAGRLGLRDNVIATDAKHPVNDLPLDYQASDICVQASREEGLGFSPLEALATEVPVVAAAVGGLKETIVDGETGWSYPPGDEAALASCLRDVLDNPDKANRRAAAGRQLVISNYESRRVFEQFEELVNELVDQVRARR